MSFSGKKFRRVKCENIKELLASTHANDDIVRTIKTKAPLVTYTLLDENTLLMDLEIDGQQMSHTFRLGEEHVMKKNDGGTYWKDKKAATKRKANIAETAMQRTGGGVDVDVVELSDLEKRILNISGGLSFATGDRNLAINPFPEQGKGNAVQPPLGSETSSHSESILRQFHDEPAAVVVVDTVAENLQTPTISTPPDESEGVRRIQDEVEMVKMTYTVEGDSVIKQVIKMPDGKTAYFRREFNDNEIKMIVTMDGTDLIGTIYYELVQ